ncbi:MAG: hypothetical protein ABEH47_07650 [Haloferacaceae archaeon]
MTDFETFECVVCGGDFEAFPGANAAETRTCSPACETERSS